MTKSTMTVDEAFAAYREAVREDERLRAEADRLRLAYQSAEKAISEHGFVYTARKRELDEAIKAEVAADA